MTKLYTKKGDQGKTSLVTGHQVNKSDLRLEAYGNLDELNSLIGVIQSLLLQEEASWCEQLRKELHQIQSDLFTIGSHLACDDSKVLAQLPQLGKGRTEELEGAMDAADGELPKLKNFILPGGHLIASHLQLARCVCRRAERECVKLSEVAEVEPPIIQYLNRLSDYLFSMGRLSNHRFGHPEPQWTHS